MSIRKHILTTVCLLAALSAGAQDNREQIELLTMEGVSAVFSSEGFAPTKKDAVEQAKMAVLRRLLYDGVENFNFGEPIVTSGFGTNLWLTEFFTGKYPAYKNFIDGIELIGNFDESAAGEVHCRANVIVKHELLMEQARTQGVTGQPSQPRPQQQTPNKPKPKKSFL